MPTLAVQLGILKSMAANPQTVRVRPAALGFLPQYTGSSGRSPSTERCKARYDKMVGLVETILDPHVGWAPLPSHGRQLPEEKLNSREELHEDIR